MKMKRITISALKGSATFDKVRGSYYDYAAEIYSSSKDKENEIRRELLSKDWREIQTSDSILSVFLKDRHIIRMVSIWK